MLSETRIAMMSPTGDGFMRAFANSVKEDMVLPELNNRVGGSKSQKATRYVAFGKALERSKLKDRLNVIHAAGCRSAL